MNNIDYYQLVANMPVAYSLHKMIYNDKGKAIDYEFLYVNHYFEEFTGMKANDIIGRTCMNLFPETEQYWIDKFDECIQNNSTISYDNYSKALDGHYQVTAYSPGPAQFITLTIDVSEQKKTLYELTQSEERYRLTQAVGGIGSWEYCIDSKKYWNSEYLRKLFGIQNTENDIDSEIRECIVENFIVDNALTRLIEHNEPYDITFKIRRKDNNTERILNSRAQLITTNSCSKKLVRGIITDITEQKDAEQKVIDSEQNFRSLIESIKDMIIIADLDGKILFVNNIVSKKLGITPEQAVKLNIYDFHSFDLHDRLKFDLRNAVNEKSDTACNSYKIVYLTDKDSNKFPARIKVNFGKWNNKMSVFGLIEDITAELESNSRFDKIFRRNSALMAIIDSNSKKIIDINDAVLRRFEIEKQDIIGKTILEMNMIHPDDLIIFNESSEILKENGFADNREIRLLKSNGQVLTGLFSAVYIEGSTEKHILLVMIDVTERKFYENKIIENSINTNKVLNIAACFIQQGSESNDYDRITDVLREISGAKYLLMNILENEYSKTVSISGEISKIELVNKALNKNLKNHKWLRNNEFDNKWMNNRVTEFTNMNNFISGEIDSKSIKYIQSLFNIGPINMIRIEGFNRVVGNFIFIFDDNSCFVNTELIEMFTYQVGQYIERIHAEENLKKKMDEMERFYKLTVNRELNMVELKKEVNELLVKLGETPKYNIPII